MAASGYSSDGSDPALRGDLSMDTDFDFDISESSGCQDLGPGPARPAYLTGLGPELKRRGKGEGGRAGGGVAKPAKEKRRGPGPGRPVLDIHTAGLVGPEAGLPEAQSPTLGADGKILCRICGDSAVRHVHYGGHCCFSCKAFFRWVTPAASSSYLTLCVLQTSRQLAEQEQPELPMQV
jgi:hypothetical protein